MINSVRSRRKKQAWFMAILGSLSLLGVIFITIDLSYDFAKHCEGYLKLAGDAPTVEKADSFLRKALSYMETKKLTSGNSAYFYKVPQNDVGIWYEQLKGAKETTDAIIAKSKGSPASQLERDNVLMKIREVVLDNDKNGTLVTVPAHIDWFPYQWGMLIWWIGSFVLTTVGWIYVKITKHY